MSIAISAGLETPDASYPDMAAGPELEPVEASPAACGGGSGHLHCYMGLPYADHNYGARPPPTPPASPQPAGPIRSEELPLVPTAQDEVSRGTTFSTSEDGSYGADVTRCICGFTHDDGYMICCDRCSVWQHIDCMGIDRQHIPETYLCEHCQPRNLDLNRAILLQTRKRENLSDRDTSATESGDEVPMELYTTFRHATASLVLTAARPHCKSSDKRRKRSRDKEPPAVTTRAKKAFREGSRRSSRGKASAPETDLADSPLLWESKMKTWMEQYEEASSNQYSEEMQILLRLEEAQRTATPAYSSRGATFKPPVESYPQKNRKILKAVRDLAPNTLIIEYRGKFMLRHQFEANGYFCKRPYPFVLFYSKFHGLDVCVDARSFGNEARFVRRSCSPNAEVRHIIDGGTLRLYLYSVRHITRGGEITIGFDYDYGSCKFKVDCACFRGTLECPVQRRHAEPTENLGSAGESRRRRGRRDREAPREKNAEGAQNQNIAVDGDYAKGKAVGENRQWKMSPLRLSIANNQTREERKMEAILQAFAQMEKRAKRREQALERIGTKVEVGGRGDVKDEPPSVPEAEAPAPAQPEVDAVKEESAGDPGAMQITSAGKVSRSKQRKSLSRSRAHVGQQRRRSRTISACSELPPVSPAECLEAPPPEAPESQPPAAPESETPLAPSLDASPSHSSSPALSCQAVLKYPKTKKHLVSEWMVEKQERTVQTPEPPPDRPLRISNDPEVLATQLNSLPGMTCSPQVYSTPKHYVRFSSPFLSSRSTGVPSARRRSHELLETPPTSGFCKKRWLRQALEEEGSPGSTGGSVLVIPSEMPLSPLTEVLDATIPFNGSCLLPGSSALTSFSVLSLPHPDFTRVFPRSEVPTPLKKRRLCPLDSSMSEGSTPYGSPCATPTRPEPLEMHPIPFTLGTPPHTQPEEQAADPPPALPLIMPQEVKAEHPPSLLSSPCVRAPAVDVPSLEVKPLGAWSPQHPQVQDSNREEVRADRAADAPLADPPLPSHPPWTRSPEKAPFSLVNSNLRDLTPSHTLEPGVFSEGAGDYPYPEDTVAFVCSAGGDYTGEGGGGTLQNPPQKKKVSLLEYRKRQKEAGRSSSKGECESPIPGALALGGLCNGSTVEPYPSDTETLDRMTPHLDGPEGEEGGEGPWTVSQARERDDVHGLGLPSTCRRDRDADDEETERDDHASGKEDFESPGSHRPDSPGAGLCHSFTKRAAGDEEVETPAGSPCLSPSSQKPCKPPGKLAPLTPSKLPPQTALQAQASPYRSQWMFHSGQPQPQASLASASYVQFSTQSVPPPPPPPAPPSSGAYCPGGTPVSAGSFPGYQSAVASPFSPGSRAVLQAHHSLNYQSSVAPPPPPHPHQTPPLLHISLASPVQQQHQILLTAVPPSSILSSASPPPPPPPQSQTVSQQHPPSGGTLFSLQQAPPPPPPPPPVSSSNPSLHFQGTGGFQASHLYPGTSGTSVVTLTSYSPHQQGVIPAPSQQLGPVQALAVPSRGALSTSAPFHGSGYLGSGWH